MNTNLLKELESNFEYHANYVYEFNSSECPAIHDYFIKNNLDKKEYFISSSESDLLNFNTYTKTVHYISVECSSDVHILLPISLIPEKIIQSKREDIMCSCRTTLGYGRLLNKFKKFLNIRFVYGNIYIITINPFKLPSKQFFSYNETKFLLKNYELYKKLQITIQT